MRPNKRLIITMPSQHLNLFSTLNTFSLTSSPLMQSDESKRRIQYELIKQPKYVKKIVLNLIMIKNRTILFVISPVARYSNKEISIFSK